MKRDGEEPEVSGRVGMLTLTLGNFNRLGSCPAHATYQKEPESMATFDSFKAIELDANHRVFLGKVPPSRLLATVADETWFNALWNRHPAEPHEIVMHGHVVKTPRWQAAFGEDYQYTGRVNKAVPVTAEIQPFWTGLGKRSAIR